MQSAKLFLFAFGLITRVLERTGFVRFMSTNNIGTRLINLGMLNIGPISPNLEKAFICVTQPHLNLKQPVDVLLKLDRLVRILATRQNLPYSSITVLCLISNTPANKFRNELKAFCLTKGINFVKVATKNGCIKRNKFHNHIAFSRYVKNLVRTTNC